MWVDSKSNIAPNRASRRPHDNPDETPVSGSIARDTVVTVPGYFTLLKNSGGKAILTEIMVVVKGAVAAVPA